MKYFTDRWRLLKKHRHVMDPLRPVTPIECVYDVVNTLDKDDTIQRLQEFKRWPVAKTLIKGKSFQERIKEGNYAPGTFGDEYKQWMAKDDFADLVISVLGGKKTKSKLLNAYLKNTIIAHDLIHFFNGYGTDTLSELNVLCFDQAKEWRRSWSALIGITAWFSLRRYGLYVALVYLRWCIESYNRGRRALDFMYVDWEQMFDLPLDEVKIKVGISDSPRLWNDSRLQKYKHVLQKQR